LKPKHVTTETRKLGDFTVSADPGKWAVVRPLTKKERALLSSADCIKRFPPERRRLKTKDGIAELLEHAITDKKLRHPHRLAVIGELTSRGLVLLPYGPASNRFRRFRNPDQLYPGASKFISGFHPSTSVVIGKFAGFSLLILLLATVEARKMRPGEETAKRWIMAMLDASGSGRWINGLGFRIITGLRNLAASFSLNEVTRKYSRISIETRHFAGNSTFRHWQDAHEKYLNEKHYGDVGKHRSAFNLLVSFWRAYPEQIEPDTFFSGAKKKAFFDWYMETHGRLSNDRVTVIRSLDSFIRWYAVKQSTLVRANEVTGALDLRRGCEWPLRQRDLDELAAVPQNKPSVSVQRYLPLEYLTQLEAILLEDDMAWPKTRNLDWITWIDPKTRKEQRIYCPVLPYIILLVIKLPIRSVQARRLDSGEGDSEWFDQRSEKWARNYGPNAGHFRLKTRLTEPRRGVLRRIEDPWNERTLCGFFINSNKTNDRKYLYSEKSGYVISWHNKDVIDIVTKVREWQEEYNSVKRPLPYREVRRGVFGPSAGSVLERRPDAFYLFRYPGGHSGVFREHPPTGQVMRYFWFELLAELERRLAATMPNPPKLISNWKGASPQASYFPLHGLRVGGLTRLAQAGVHPWILQNIVAGHASWVMTLYYLKPSPAHISDHINEKYVEAMLHQQAEFAHFLSDSTIESVRLAIATKDLNDHAINALLAVRKIPGSASMMARMDHGICPNGRTRCEEGMPISERTSTRPRQHRDAFVPVPTTVGGAPDCSRCRFFISGTPFIDGLRVRTNEISFAAHKSAQRQNDLVKTLDDLESDRVEAQRKDSAFASTHDVHRLRQELKVETDVLCDLAESLHAHAELFHKVRALLGSQIKGKKRKGQAVPALLYSEAPEFKFEMRSHFEALDELCHLSKWFTSVRQEGLQRERREKVIRMLVRQKKPPLIALLSEEEANTAIDQLTSFLYRRMSRPAVQELIDGKKSFTDFGIESDVDAVMKTMIERRPSNLVGLKGARSALRIL
jgi:hypothetical protein